MTQQLFNPGPSSLRVARSLSYRIPRPTTSFPGPSPSKSTKLGLGIPRLGKAGGGAIPDSPAAPFTGPIVHPSPGRADTVDELTDLIQLHGVEPVRWYGVWLFVDWLEFSGAELDVTDSVQVAKTAAVELEASRRDPYRQLSRVFHLVGRKASS